MLGERDSQALIVDWDRTRRRFGISLLSQPALLRPVGATGPHVVAHAV